MSEEQPKTIGVDRAGMLARYHESQGLPPVVTEEVSADAPEEASAPVDASSQSTPESQPEGGTPAGSPAGTPVEKEVVVPSAKVEKPGEETKLVPKQALDEEREKRKAKTLENRQLSESLALAEKTRAELEQRVKELEAKVSGDTGEPDSEVARQLAEENRKLRDANQKAEAEKQRATQAASDAAMAQKIQAADTQMAAEGFPGFKEFTVDVHNAILAKVKSGELEEKDITEATWSSIYKQVVFPAKKSIFEAKVKQEKLDAKNKLKEDANLTPGPGNAPEGKEERDLDAPQTAEGYMKFRKVLH